jgi:hypothetical protein
MPSYASQTSKDRRGILWALIIKSPVWCYSNTNVANGRKRTPMELAQGKFHKWIILSLHTWRLVLQ